MKHLLIFSLSIFFYCSAFSQTPLAEFQTPKVPRNLQAFSVGDTLFMFYDEPAVSTKICYQVKSDGTSEKIVTQLKAGILVMGVVKYNDELYFYYVSGEKRSLTLEASVYNETLKQEMPANKGVEIYDEIWGISTNKKSRRLELILYNSEEAQLKVVGIDRLTRSSEKRFVIPVKLPDDYIDFIDESRLVPIAQGASKAKLIKTANEIYMTIDKTYDEAGSSDPGTIIVKFNIEKETVVVQEIVANTKKTFRSFAYNDVLYRSTISKKEFCLAMFNTADGKLIKDTTIMRDTLLLNSLVYLRNKKGQSIHKKETLYDLIGRGNLCLPSIIIPMQNDSCEKELIWGTYFTDQEDGYGSIIPLLIHPFTAPIGLLLRAAVKRGRNNGISRYFYLTLDCNDRFRIDTYSKSPIRKVIDDYEIALRASGIVPQYKTYADIKNGCIGLYVDDHHHKLILTWFEE